MPKHQGVLSSGVIVASGQVSASGAPALLYGYILIGGTTISQVGFRDGGASGTVLWTDTIAAQTNVGDATATVSFRYPVVFTKDLYAILVGTGASLYVSYLPL